MFKLYQSNCFDKLKSIFLYLIKKKSCKKIFPKEIIIIIPNYNTSFMLKMFLSKKLGICANFNFLLIDKFIENIYKLIISDIYDDYFFKKENLFWVVLYLLPKLLNNSEFFYIKEYLYNDINNKKLVSLSFEISNIYNQYLKYRVDWLHEWEKFKLVDYIDNIHQNWQSILWREIVFFLNKNFSCKWNKSKLYFNFIKNINKKYNIFLEENIDIIYIFNVSYISPVYLDVIFLLSKYISVNYFLLNPCKKYNNIFFYNNFFKKNNISNIFLNDKKNFLNCNLILLNYGKSFYEFLFLLSKYSFCEKKIFINNKYNNNISLIKNDILNFSNKLILKKNNIKDDKSIIIKSFCGYLNELNELKFFLSNLLVKFNYKLSDIVIIVSDLNLYYPYIDSIFSYKGNNYIPYNIMENNILYDSKLLNIFLSLLNIYNKNINFLNMVYFLKKKVISDKFNISLFELDIIINISKDIGICCDINNILSKYSIKEFDYFSLLNAINRILLGYCINDNFCKWNKIIPYSMTYSNFISDLIEKLVNFLFKIIFWQKKLSLVYFFSDWINICIKFVKDFFDFNIIKKNLLFNNIFWNKLLFSYKFYKNELKINIEYFKNILFLFLKSKKINKNYSINKINFCSIGSLKSFKYKVVCIIGINDGVFPKKKSFCDFNLINIYKRICDKDKINDDKYLFLEILNSVVEKLYISYVNFSFIKNKICYSSLLLDNFLNYINNLYKKNFLNKEKYFFKKYFFLKKKEIKIKKKHFLINSNFNFLKMKKNFFLDDLHKFWIHPIKYFFNILLKINYFLFDISISNYELFNYNFIKFYLFKIDIINFFINNKYINNISIYLKCGNLLPFGFLGKLLWEKEKNNILILIRRIKNDNIIIFEENFFCKFHGINFYGKFFKNSNNNLIKILPKKLKILDILIFWIDHLFYCFLGYKKNSYLYSYDGIYYFFPLDKFISEEYLSYYIYGFLNSYIKPIFLLPKCSHIWMFSSYNFITKKKFSDIYLKRNKKKIYNIFYGNYFYKGEINDIYIYNFVNKYNLNINIDFIISYIEKWLFPLFKNLFLKK